MARQSHIRFTIPDPCNVPWDGMTPVDSGRKHCASCDKVIVDFSQMSDDELMLYFRHSKGKVCGRFDNRQLDRRMPLLPERRTKAKWWRAAALLPLILFSKSARTQYYQVISGGEPDTVALAKETPVKDTLVAQQEQLAPDTTRVEEELVAQTDSVQQEELVVKFSPPPDGYVIQIEQLTISGAMTYILGDICGPEPNIIVGGTFTEPGGFDDPLEEDPDTPKIASPDPYKQLTDKEQRPADPPPPALPASTDLTGILPGQRRKPWR